MQRLAILLACLLLQACSDSTKGLGASLWHSIVGDDGIQLTNDELQNMRYASQYMRINNGPQIFVVLAYDEEGQQKWVTQDRAMIVTEKGRIVKTTGLSDNLQQVTNRASDPLVKANQIVDGTRWTRQMAWTEHQQVHMATARSTYTWEGTETLDVANSTTSVRVLDEEVTGAGKTWHNRFWIDSEGEVRQSKQYLGPDYWPVTTILLKAAKQ